MCERQDCREAMEILSQAKIEAMNEIRARAQNTYGPSMYEALEAWHTAANAWSRLNKLYWRLPWSIGVTSAERK